MCRGWEESWNVDYEGGLDHEFAEKEYIIKEKEGWYDEHLENKRAGRMDRGN